MNTDEHGLTERILGAAFEVSNCLGAGFLERVYDRALLMELGLRGIKAVPQASFSVNYKGRFVFICVYPWLFAGACMPPDGHSLSAAFSNHRMRGSVCR
jgi:hypothetical protein